MQLILIFFVGTLAFALASVGTVAALAVERHERLADAARRNTLAEVDEVDQGVRRLRAVTGTRAV